MDALSHVELIDKWPTIRAFGEDIGVEYNTAKHIRRRGVLPARYWDRFIKGAERRRLDGVTFKALASAVSEPAPITAQPEVAGAVQ